MLHIRPAEILNEWGCEELLVTFGYYANSIAGENYDNYKRLSSEQKKGMEKPPKYSIVFLTFDQLAEISRPKTEQEKAEEMKEKALIEAFQKGGGGFG